MKPAPLARRALWRWVLALFYGAAGVLHLLHPAPFLSIMPAWVPAAESVVAITGVAELLGAAGLIQPYSERLRRVAGWGLALYALCVWPANWQHFLIDQGKPDGGLGLAYHVPRLAFQPVLVWLAAWAGGAAPWPLRPRRPDSL